MQSQREERLGIYCLANDRVLEWMKAFLESLRTYEPSCQLIVIPFDENIEKLSQLATKYNFEFFQNKTLLEELDEIGNYLHPDAKYYKRHIFRKFAVFWGPLNHFLFLDADVVVLGKLEELFEAYSSSKCDFMYSGRDMRQVYKPGNFREKMIDEYSAIGFNAGSFMSSKNILTLEELKALSSEALPLMENFADKGDQAFFNYCVDIKRLDKKAFSDVIPDLALGIWAGREPIELSQGAYRSMDPKWPNSFGKRQLYAHWAGFGVGPHMPNRQLFLHFRLKSEPWTERVKYNFRNSRREIFNSLVKTRKRAKNLAKTIVKPSGQ